MHTQTSDGRNLERSMAKLHFVIWRYGNCFDLTVGLSHHRAFSFGLVIALALVLFL
jgi:hypothetical protein